MRTARNSQIMRTIPLLIAICLFSFPVYAQYSGGTGEPNDPHHIATAEDLMLLGDSPEDYDKDFILTDDIDLDPNLPEGRIFTKALIAPNFVYPFRETRTTFTGSFDGNNHVIHNLVIDGSGDLGIFGFIGSNGQVKNLHVENVVINSKDSNVGGLAGENWGIITDCHISGYVYGRSDIGGLVGKNGSYVLIRSGADTQYNANGISNEFIEGKLLVCPG